MRRSRGDIEQIQDAILATLATDHPQTLRGLFYQLVSQQVVPKTEAAYKGVVGRLTARMRRSGLLPYEWLADNTRWMRKPRTFGSLKACLDRTARTYRRALWDEMPAYVEMWLEKDALAGVLYEVTDPWDVPLMVTRGYPSLSFLFEAAETLRHIRKPAYLYYFGDFDPSGLDIPRKVEADLRRWAPRAEMHFRRVAVTDKPIRELHLPTRPTKRTDSRIQRFGMRQSVEVDAIPAAHLRQIAETCIAQHVDRRELRALQVAEESEREILLNLARKVAAHDGF